MPGGEAEDVHALNSGSRDNFGTSVEKSYALTTFPQP